MNLKQLSLYALTSLSLITACGKNNNKEESSPEASTVDLPGPVTMECRSDSGVFGIEGAILVYTSTTQFTIMGPHMESSCELRDANNKVLNIGEGIGDTCSFDYGSENASVNFDNGLKVSATMDDPGDYLTPGPHNNESVILSDCTAE
jgi:hypothetical protein